MGCSSVSELPGSMVTFLNTTLESWKMRKIFADVLPKVHSVLEGELSGTDLEIPVSSSNWSFSEIFKQIVKRLQVPDSHNRMNSVLLISNGTMLATQALQLERNWALQADDIFDRNEATCSDAVDMEFHGNVRRLIRAGYVLKDDSFSDDPGHHDHQIGLDGEVDIDMDC